MRRGLFFFFFFQAEDGIRDLYVTGVQTCALPISGISANEASGGTLTQLDHPLARALAQFALRPEPQQQLRLSLQGHVRFFSLSKSTVDGAALPRRGTSPAQGLVILVEDVSEQRALAAQVAHQDRLASIGRLAAGIAHEIGNPLTGIACIAQNLAHEDNASVL